MSTEAHEPVSPTWDALRKLGEQCPHPLKVEGECLIVLDSDRRRFTDLGTPEMAQFVLASVNYVQGILAQPASPVLHDEKDLASYWKAAHDRVVAQNWELSRQIDALQKVGEQCLRPQQTPTGEGERIRGGELELLIAAQAARKADLAHPQQGGERDGDVRRIAELEAALKPFAEIGRLMGRTPIMRAVSVGYLGVEADGLNSHARSTATVADFRAARDVLKRPVAPTSPSKSSGEEA